MRAGGGGGWEGTLVYSLMRGGAQGEVCACGVQLRQRSQANHLPARKKKKKLAESVGGWVGEGGYDQQVARPKVNASSSGTPDGP